MIQIKVQWVLPEKLADGVETDEAVLRKFGYVPVIPLAALTEMARGLKVQGKADEDIPDDKEEAYQYGYWDALTDIQRLLAQLEAHKKEMGYE